MHIGRTIPPAAASFGWRDILSGCGGIVFPERPRKRFAAELKDYLGKRHCFLLDSGKAALTLTLACLKKVTPNRDRVLIPAYTCYSVPAAIIQAGLKPVLCDIAPGTFDFNEEELADYLDDEKLLCVVPTHLFGCPADIYKLRRLTQGLNVPIVEDAAQAFGARDGHMLLGTEGDVGIFSLGRGKALTTMHGGILVTDNDQYARLIERAFEDAVSGGLIHSVKLAATAAALKLFIAPSIFWLPKNMPCLRLGETIYDPDFQIAAMTGFQAGMARNWQKRLAADQEKRRQNSSVWAALAGHGRCRPYLEMDALPDLVRFPVICDDAAARMDLLERSERRGLGLAAGYPGAICDIPELGLEPGPDAYPVARWLARCLMTLPVHPSVSPVDREGITKLLSTVPGEAVEPEKCASGAKQRLQYR